MGRGKLSMELIPKERSRILTFKKRKEGLTKKLHELTTLCDVSACMIISGPVQENRAVYKPEIWPQNPDEIRRLIGIYKANSKDSGSRSKSFGLADFFKERNKKAEEKLAKVRKNNVEAKYPTWDELLNFANEAELRALAAVLSSKAEIVNSRIDFLKGKKQESDMMNNMVMDFAPANLNLSQSHNFYTLNQDQEIRPVNLSQSHSFYPPLNHDQEIKPVFDMGFKNLQHNSSGNYASFEHQVLHDQAAAGDGLGNPMMCYNNTMMMPLQQIYFAPPMLQPVRPPSPPPQPYMEWPVISGVAPPAPSQQYYENVIFDGDGSEDDIIRYLLKSG